MIRFIFARHSTASQSVNQTIDMRSTDIHTMSVVGKTLWMSMCLHLSWSVVTKPNLCIQVFQSSNTERSSQTFVAMFRTRKTFCDAMSRLRSGFQAQRAGRLAEALSTYQDALSLAEKAEEETGPSFARCFSLSATGWVINIL